MTDPVQLTIKDIRIQLRLAMNGVVSTSMREKGINYKLNFGVSLPKIKEIATRYDQDSSLAEALWREDVRELKILATLLQPIDLFTKEQADQWASTVTQQEIAELYTANLLQKLSYAKELATDWIQRQEEFFRVMGFLLYARLFMQDTSLDESGRNLFFLQAKQSMDAGISRTQRAALLALKHYGRQSPIQATAVLSYLSDYAESSSTEKQEFYEDLKFEFDYYQ